MSTEMPPTHAWLFLYAGPVVVLEMVAIIGIFAALAVIVESPAIALDGLLEEYRKERDEP